MRIASFIAILTAALVLSCGPPADEVEACEPAPQCLGESACDDICVGVVVCCECLAQLECLDDGFDAGLCEQNINGGGGIDTDPGCSTDEARCGTQCDGVISVS